MKWNEQNTAVLKDLVFLGKSNKEISETMNIEINNVYAKRSQLGITKSKVNIVLSADEEHVDSQMVNKRTVVQIRDEIKLVDKAKQTSFKKTERCVKRLLELEQELDETTKSLKGVK